MSDVKTDRLNPVSFDFNRREGVGGLGTGDEEVELAALFEPQGYILIFDPIKKSKSKLIWMNTGKRGSLSKRTPILVRWVPGSTNELIAVFEDNTMWILNKTLQEEEKATNGLLNALKNAGGAGFIV
jgi:hypothetical protein